MRGDVILAKRTDPFGKETPVQPSSRRPLKRVPRPPSKMARGVVGGDLV